uniref:Uncharacterized protein n=1 Tax=Moniliophthora roreri TaxID=221103 RepID=A0A0W0FU38_MONRR
MAALPLTTSAAGVDVQRLHSKGRKKWDGDARSVRKMGY